MPISLHWRWHLPWHSKFHSVPSHSSAKADVLHPCTMSFMYHQTPMSHLIAALLRPSHLFTRQEVLSKPSPVPPRPGVYVWYFREVPPGVPVEGCRRHHGLPLLYVGISPRKPPTNGKVALKMARWL